MSPASRTPGGTRRAHPGTPGLEAARESERELLLAIRRHGQLTVAGVALKTSLSVKEAGRMLSGLAGKGRLGVRVERGRLLYSLREGRG
jgi:predicted transcriptional regulator of viral defense system